MAKKEKKAAAAEEAAPSGPPPTPRLLEKYEKEVLPALASKLGRKNRMSLPRLEKIVVNMGVGSAVAEKKNLEDAVAAMTQITGQKPLVTTAQRYFGIQTSRRPEDWLQSHTACARMYEFLDRLVSLALPRVRDFRGLEPNAFDGQGNYSLGLSEQLVFPELNPDKFTRVQGMNVTMVISGHSNDESRKLLRGLGMPFKVEEGKGKKGAA